MVFGLGPMGCIPLQRVLSASGECQDRTNKLAIGFNKAGSKLIDELQKQLPNASFRFGDAYDVVNDVISNPNKYGKYIYTWYIVKLKAFATINVQRNLIYYFSFPL